MKLSTYTRSSLVPRPSLTAFFTAVEKRAGRLYHEADLVLHCPLLLSSGIYSHTHTHTHTHTRIHKHTQLLFMQAACSPLPGLEPIPECCPNGPVWVWWYVHVLPTTVQRKLEFLECTSLRQRLLMLKESLPLPQASSQC